MRRDLHERDSALARKGFIVSNFLSHLHLITSAQSAPVPFWSAWAN
jgi:hypothetical protein